MPEKINGVFIELTNIVGGVRMKIVLMTKTYDFFTFDAMQLNFSFFHI